MMPVIFFALRALKVLLTLVKVNSIGLYYGEYGKLKMYLKLSSRIFDFDFSKVCEDKLSMKRHTLSVPLSCLKTPDT